MCRRVKNSFEAQQLVLPWEEWAKSRVTDEKKKCVNKYRQKAGAVKKVWSEKVINLVAEATLKGMIWKESDLNVLMLEREKSN